VSALFRNLLHFARLLHGLGLDVPAGRMVDVGRALQSVDLGVRDDVYHTLRSLLVHRRRDLAVFDEAFQVFWRPARGDRTQLDLRALGERRKFGAPEMIGPAGEQDDATTREPIARVQRTAPTSASSQDALRTKDFADFTADEILEAERMLARLVWTPPSRPTHRWHSGAGGALDLRRALRASTRHAGEPIVLPTRRRRTRARPLLLLCDVSGSMERYTRMLLQFIYSVSVGRERVEAFVFATRLSRLTPLLERRGPGRALARLARHVPDLGGGTRTGEAIRTFHRTWARRLGVRSAVVLLISDGWDRGDPELLREGMARLQRSSHRLIWLNPLLGAPSYTPATRGMRAALPYVDDFLPAHNLVSLDALAAHLNALPARAGRGGVALFSRAGQGQVPEGPVAATSWN
jgi:hypothetical protein|tara:strand:- start:3964 stop:5184 length:1221 start_codon:yes stop_codon:yes gene_type:complete